jgi:hypothetical protein
MARVWYINFLPVPAWLPEQPCFWPVMLQRFKANTDFRLSVSLPGICRIQTSVCS